MTGAILDPLTTITTHPAMYIKQSRKCITCSIYAIMTLTCDLSNQKRNHLFGAILTYCTVGLLLILYLYTHQYYSWTSAQLFWGYSILHCYPYPTNVVACCEIVVFVILLLGLARNNIWRGQTCNQIQNWSIYHETWTVLDISQATFKAFLGGFRIISHRPLYCVIVIVLGNRAL